MRWLTLGGVTGPVVFSVVVLAAAMLRPNYSHVSSFISELGATGSPNAALMNMGGFLTGGAMLATFGVGLARSLPRERLVLAGAGLVALFGIGVATAGLFSCDLGCPQTAGSPENLIHNRVSPACFVGMIVGTGILGLRFRRFPEWRGLSTYTLLTSVLGLGFFLALGSSLESRELTGLWQRLLLATLFLWCAVVGVHAFRHAQLEGEPLWPR